MMIGWSVASNGWWELCWDGCCPAAAGPHRDQRIEAWLASIASCVSSRAMSMWAPPSPISPVQGREDRDAGVEAGEQIGDRNAYAHRPAARIAVGQAGDAHQAAHALDHEIITGAVRVRPVLAESGNRSDDQLRFRRAQCLGIESELLEAADLEIFDHDIALPRQLPN
jgi:hypothetical protein